MALHITLLLTCTFFSGALALRCYVCSGPPGTCTLNTLPCPSRCGSMTTNIYSYGRKIVSNSMKTCTDPVVCVNGSMNSGQSKVTFSSQCCNGEICNKEYAPDLPQQSLNGKRCFTCSGTDCLKTLACEGDETLCFITTVDIVGKKVTRKGCTSKLFCGTNATLSLGLPVQDQGFGVYMKCCEGNLCNAAQSLRVYFVILVPLLSLYLF